MYRLDSYWPFATCMRRESSCSLCPQLVDGTCCPGTESTPKLNTTTSSSGKNRPYCIRSLWRVRWKRNWFWSWLWSLQIQYSSGMDTYRGIAFWCWMAWEALFALPHLLETYGCGAAGCYYLCVWELLGHYPEPWGEGCSTGARGSSGPETLLLWWRYTRYPDLW